jgi:type IV secretory pathway VirB4 component
MKLFAHRLTTANLGAIFPFTADSFNAGYGCFIGKNLCGGSFFFDPFAMYNKGLVTNPNTVIFGQIGKGKSSLIKSFVIRQIIHNRRVWIIDPKGEYSKLAEILGYRTIKLFPGSNCKLNPLDSRNYERSGSQQRINRLSHLLSSMITSMIKRNLSPLERSCLTEALYYRFSLKPDPVLPEIAEELINPTFELGASIGIAKNECVKEIRDVAIELKRLCQGDLAGIFDGPTTGGVDLESKIVILDLSALYNSEVLGLLMSCVLSFLESFIGNSNREKILMIIDEGWAILKAPSMADWLQGSFKLSRAYGMANIAVFHRPSDLYSSSDVGSRIMQLTAGLLADSETRVVFNLPNQELEHARNLLGLNDTHLKIVNKLGRGTALWTFGERSYLVRHILTNKEKLITFSDDAMVE